MEHATVEITKYEAPLEAAQEAACELVSLLKDNCERIEIAGSIRRQKAHVGDIELVAVPKLIETKSNTLFGEPVMQSCLENLLWEMEQELIIKRRTTNAHAAWGSRYKRIAFAHFNKGTDNPLGGCR